MNNHESCKALFVEMISQAIRDIRNDDVIVVQRAWRFLRSPSCREMMEELGLNAEAAIDKLDLMASQ